MLRLIIYVLPIVYCYIMSNRISLVSRRLYGIKYLDHNMDNKTIFDKFEYYSLIGNKEKQMECFQEIMNYTKNNNHKKNN